MAAPESDYEDTLNKMANLESLSTFITEQTTALDAKRGEMTTKLSNMQTQVADIKQKIGSIRFNSGEAARAIQKLINESGKKQQDSLKIIQASIKAMLNMGKLDDSITNLEGEISGLTTVVNDAGPPPSGTTPPGEATRTRGSLGNQVPVPGRMGTRATPTTFRDPDLTGGYTYGKSRSRSKSSRRNIKKRSRTKGSKRR